MSLQVPCDYKVENKSGAIGSNTSKMTKAYIADRVTLIYDEIIRDLESTYHREDEVDTIYVGRNVLEEQYCSTEWNQLHSSMQKKEEEDGDCFIDFDYWIDAQDFSELRVDKVKVEYFDDNEAMVSVILYNFGDRNKIRLVLCYERGDWFVDDFGPGMKASMQNYLEP